MDLGSEAASSVLNAGSKVAESTAEKAVEGTASIAYLLLQGILKTAVNLPKNTNLEKLVKSGKEIKMTELSLDDLKVFKKQAKKLGIEAAVIQEKNKDTRTVLYSADCVERVEKIINQIVSEKVKLSDEKDRPSIKEKLTEIREMKEEINNLSGHEIEKGNTKEETKSTEKNSTEKGDR